MFDVLVYLYENYWRPDACPDHDQLTRKLSSVGFESDEIQEALRWLDKADPKHEKLAVQSGFVIHNIRQQFLRLNKEESLDGFFVSLLKL